jgi:hypothetical protein
LEPEILKPEDVQPRLEKPQEIEQGEDIKLGIPEEEPIEEREILSGKQVMPRKIKTFGKPLDFDQHLQLADHEGCQASHYPDLSLTLVERNKQREQ